MKTEEERSSNTPCAQPGFILDHVDMKFCISSGVLYVFVVLVYVIVIVNDIYHLIFYVIIYIHFSINHSS